MSKTILKRDTTFGWYLDLGTSLFDNFDTGAYDMSIYDEPTIGGKKLSAIIDELGIAGPWLKRPRNAIKKTNSKWIKGIVPWQFTESTENLSIYFVDGGKKGISNLSVDLSVDNQVAIWVNGEFRYAGYSSYGSKKTAHIGPLNAGKNIIQILRGDWWGAAFGDWTFHASTTKIVSTSSIANPSAALQRLYDTKQLEIYGGRSQSPLNSGWSYGYKLKDSPHFIPYEASAWKNPDTRGVDPNGYAGFVAAPFWPYEPTINANVNKDKNISLNLWWLPADNKFIRGNELLLHPGNAGEKSTVRYVAASDGNYLVSATFRDLDPYGGDGAKGSITLTPGNGKGQVLFNKSWVNGGAAVKYSRTLLSLKAGDILDFEVDPNGGYDYDSTSLIANVAKVPSYSTDASRYGIISKTGFNHVTAGRTLPFQVSKINNLNKRTELQYLVTPFLDPSKPELEFSQPASTSDFERTSDIDITNQNQNYNDLTQWQKLIFEEGDTIKEFNITTVKPGEPTNSKSARLWIYNEALSNGDDDWLSNPAFEHVDFLIHSKPTHVFGDPTYNLEGEQAITKLGRFGARNSNTNTTVQVAPEQYDRLTGLPSERDFGFVAEKNIDFTSIPSLRTFRRDTDDPNRPNNRPNLFYYASDLPKTPTTDPARVFAWTARQVRNGEVGKNIVASQYGTIFENENSRPADQTQARTNTRLLSQSNDQIRPSNRLSSLDMVAPQATSLFGGITDAWNSFVGSLNSAISSVASSLYGQNQEVTLDKHIKFAKNNNTTKVYPVPKVAKTDSLKLTGSGAFLMPTRDGAGRVAVDGDSLDRFVASSYSDPRIVRFTGLGAKALRRQINQLKTLHPEELQQVLYRYPVDELNGQSLKQEIVRLSKIKRDKEFLSAISESSLIGLDGATLIGLDGATLIDLDGATFTLDSTLRLRDLDGATLRGKINVIKDIPRAGLNALSQLVEEVDGATVDGKTLKNEAKRLSNLMKNAELLKEIEDSALIGLDGATLIGLDGATLVGLDGATFAALTANTLVGLDSATLAFQEPSHLAQMSMIKNISPDILSGF